MRTHNISTSTLRELWNNWAIAFGSIALLMLCSLFLSKAFLPLLSFALAYLLMVKMKVQSARPKMGACHLTLWATAITLFWSAVIMIAINIILSERFFGGIYAVEPFNPKHPYICSLIVFPTALVICSYFLLRGHSLRACRSCQARFGYYSTDGPVAPLYYQEARYQLRLLLSLSLLLSIVDWAYYYFFYINVNFNNPDKFYFIAMPVALYLISLVFMAVRYMTMSDEMTKANPSSSLRPMMTLFRFLIVSGDRIYLSQSADGLLDSPARLIVPRRDKMSDAEVRDAISDIVTSSNEFSIKYLYEDSGYTNGANVIHYAVFLPERPDGINPSLKPQGQWTSIDQIDRDLRDGRIAPRLASEIDRIYRVTMAWKTYDRHGRRLYPIRSYRPTFRIRDFKDWTVDYGDLSWLDIATNNEDRPFFRLRRFWRKNFRH